MLNIENNISNEKITIAVDLMGGDKAPAVVCDGVKYFCNNILLNSFKEFSFIFVGNGFSKTLLDKKILQENEFIETSEYVLSSDKPSAVIRNKNTSMAICIKLVADKRANACMSAGNTGALMAMSKLYFKTINGITRPAISTIVPTKNQPAVLLDMGANLICNSQNLFEFAIMGIAFAKSAFDIDKPSVGILNIGSEDTKGNEIVQKASEMIRGSKMSSNFVGYVEGNDINLGDVNVVVTDGFTGNIVLKAIEGIGSLIKYYLKKHFQASIFAKIGYLFAKKELTKLGEKIDPNNYNGALFLGLDGIAIKSHGSANAKGIANAINVAYKLAKQDIIQKINNEIKNIVQESSSNSVGDKNISENSNQNQEN